MEKGSESFLNPTRLLIQTLEGIEIASSDPNVIGLVTTYDSNRLQMGAVQEIRNAIIRFNEQGKHSIMYIKDSFTMNNSLLIPYYFASAYSSIICPEKSFLDLSPPTYENVFFAKALGKIGVDLHVDKRKDFKTAFNSLTEEKYTEEHKSELLKLDKSFMDQITNGITSQRNISKESLESVINHGIISCNDALSQGLIDVVVPFGNLESFLAKNLRLQFDNKNILPVDEDDIVIVKFEAYILFKKFKKMISSFGKKSYPDKIAIVELNDNASGILRSLKEEKDVKAIVFRVDSPGGAYASFQELSDDIKELKKTKKVIASFGNIAASGGYLAACYADKIVANPGTVTGSIGVISMIPNLKQLFSKLGIETDTLFTDRGIHVSMCRPLSEKEKSTLTYVTDTLYEWFKQSVSEGRNISMEDVENIAQGKVWSGEQGIDIGLVDKLGGISEAIALAKEEAQSPNACLYYPQNPPLELIRKVSTTTSALYRMFMFTGEVITESDNSIKAVAPIVKMK